MCLVTLVILASLLDVFSEKKAIRGDDIGSGDDNSKEPTGSPQDLTSLISDKSLEEATWSSALEIQPLSESQAWESSAQKWRFYFEKYNLKSINIQNDSEKTELFKCYCLKCYVIMVISTVLRFLADCRCNLRFNKKKYEEKNKSWPWCLKYNIVHISVLTYLILKKKNNEKSKYLLSNRFLNSKINESFI